MTSTTATRTRPVLATSAVDADLVDAIESRGFVRTETGCLEYQGYRNELGYGLIRWGEGRGRLIRVHRVMYEAHVGPIPDGLGVLHSCDNPPCAEPTHLRPGSQLDNAADRDSRGRHNKATWTACPNGHPYPPDRPPKVDKNRCRECANERNRRYQARRRQHG